MTSWCLALVAPLEVATLAGLLAGLDRLEQWALRRAPARGSRPIGARRRESPHPPAENGSAAV